MLNVRKQPHEIEHSRIVDGGEESALQVLVRVLRRVAMQVKGSNFCTDSRVTFEEGNNVVECEDPPGNQASTKEVLE